MSTLAKYRRAVDICVAGAMQVGASTTVMLYGSLARDRIRPGKSDVLDAFVVVDDAALGSDSEYRLTLRALVAMCKEIASLGLPFHPFHYYGREEVRRRHPALFLPTWKRDGFSRIAAGQDLRRLLQTTPRSVVVARSEFFEFHRHLLSLANLCVKPMLEPSERKRIASAILQSRKKLPLLACLACNHWVEQSESLTALEELFPACDLRPLRGDCGDSAGAGAGDDPQSILAGIMDCVEELYLAVSGTIVERDLLSGRSEWSAD